MILSIGEDDFGDNGKFEQLLGGLLHQAKDYLLPDLDPTNVWLFSSSNFTVEIHKKV